MVAADLGLTHVALPVTDVDASAAFYARYADLQVVHRRVDGTGTGGVGVVWLSDLTRPFVIVLIQTAVTHVLGGWAQPPPRASRCKAPTTTVRRSATGRSSRIPTGTISSWRTGSRWTPPSPRRNGNGATTTVSVGRR